MNNTEFNEVALGTFVKLFTRFRVLLKTAFIFAGEIGQHLLKEDVQNAFFQLFRVINNVKPVIDLNLLFFFFNCYSSFNYGDITFQKY